MRRRRQQLQVSTFPFLAVLLCAMGALILVLLSMDRTAKKAALAKAQEEASETIRSRQAAHDKLVAQRQRDHEGKKRSQRQAWEKKRDALQARVSSEEQALEKELAAVQARLAEAARKLRDEEGGLAELGKQLEREKALLAKQQQAVSAARREVAGAAKQMTASDQARARLTAELARLEKALADQIERRRKDAQTYSVIPYHGKRGESRRPVYVECGAAGHVFHPGRLTLTAADDLRGELRKRLEVRKERLASAGVSDLRPYVMLLVRPDGVARYYEMQAAARDVGVEFGYEFVEADWVLDFPDEDDPNQPWMTSAPPPSAGEKPAGSGVRGVPSSAMGSSAPGRSGDPPHGHGSGKPTPGGTVAPGAGVGLGSPLVGGGGPPRRVEGGEVALGSGPSRGAETGKTGPAPGLFPQDGDPLPELPRIDSPAAVLAAPTLGQTGTPATGQTGSGQPGASPAPKDGSAAGGNNARAGGNVDGNLDNGIRPAPARPRGEIEAPALVPNFGGGAGAKGSPRGVASSSQPGEAGKGEPRIGPSLPEPDAPRRPLPLRPARLDGGESIVFVECKEDTVLIHPSRRRVAIESLNHSPAYNPLVQAVRQQAQRRQAQSRAGDPVKVQVRFLVHRDGEKTFHLAYPALEVLKLPMSRYGLQAWDDVNRLVSEY